jgi:hypothetical protein
MEPYKSITEEMLDFRENGRKVFSLVFVDSENDFYVDNDSSFVDQTNIAAYLLKIVNKYGFVLVRDSMRYGQYETYKVEIHKEFTANSRHELDLRTLTFRVKITAFY